MTEYTDTSILAYIGGKSATFFATRYIFATIEDGWVPQLHES
jgi:hypothetical protein